MATYAAYRHVELDNVGYGKKRVLKPPGGGSSDIFGAATDSSPRVIKQHQRSQLGSFFNGGGNDQPSSKPLPTTNGTGSNSNSSVDGGISSLASSPETPRSKPGNDSYKRLFGPPDARPPSTPNSKYHMRSNISLSSDSNSECGGTNSSMAGTPNCRSPKFAKPRQQSLVGICNGDSTAAMINGTNGYHHNDVVGGSSCMPRNPVTGDGVDVKPHASRRIVRRNKDGNPVTGTGYEAGQQNGTISGSASSAGSEKSSTDSSPSTGSSGVLRMKNRVPPGGFSSGLW